MPPLRFASLALPALFALPGAVRAADVTVSDTAQLTAAIAGAAAGDRILLAPGLYQPAGNLNCVAAGSAAQPIQVRAQVAGTATLRFGGSGGIAEGFKVSAPHWRFEGLVIEGACASHANCEHALHLAGNADGTVIRNNRLVDFNAQIKSNGANGEFPDDVLVEGNALYDTVPRNTSNPVTKIDVVGGRRWIVRGNTLHDFSKGQGDLVSYGAFLKGGSRDGVFERNLVECQRLHAGGIRIGLSFGGGGTGAGFCEGSCDPEHSGGIMRNNVILDCSDVGIYVNKGANTRLFHNTLYATAGIDLRFASSSGVVAHNVANGTLRNRDGATAVFTSNLSQVPLAKFEEWFVDPAASDFGLRDGSALVGKAAATDPPTADDFCGNARDDGAPDLGALEYDDDFACQTQVGGGLGPGVFQDGFEG